jgi:hypothetical protein
MGSLAAVVCQRRKPAVPTNAKEEAVQFLQRRWLHLLKVAARRNSMNVQLFRQEATGVCLRGGVDVRDGLDDACWLLRNGPRLGTATIAAVLQMAAAYVPRAIARVDRDPWRRAQLRNALAALHARVAMPNRSGPVRACRAAPKRSALATPGREVA